MSIKRADFVPNLTFVSTHGPKLDNATNKAMRAHVTKANFARRRRRLVLEHSKRKQHPACAKPSWANDHGWVRPDDQIVGLRGPLIDHAGFGQSLDGKDAFFINHLMHAFGRLHLTTSIPPSDPVLAVMKSDWARFLHDPTMLNVSLYFGRHVYVLTLQQNAVRIVMDAHERNMNAYKGKAIQAVRERLNYGSNGFSDSFIASILILTVIDQGLGNFESWKIHITGLLQVIKTRSKDMNDPSLYWAWPVIKRTILQGLLLFTRHDESLVLAIEKTGVFNSMFSATGKQVAQLILTAGEDVVSLDTTYKQPNVTPLMERTSISQVINSLDTAVHLNSTSRPGEAFLTLTALSIKIYLEFILHHTTNHGKAFEHTALQVMQILQKPEEQLCSSLTLCCSLQSRFWQTMMGALAAPNADSKKFFMCRLERIAAGLALTSWNDAVGILQKFFWIPHIFSAPCYQIFSEVV